MWLIEMNTNPTFNNIELTRSLRICWANTLGRNGGVGLADSKASISLHMICLQTKWSSGHGEAQERRRWRSCSLRRKESTCPLPLDIPLLVRISICICISFYCSYSLLNKETSFTMFYHVHWLWILLGWLASVFVIGLNSKEWSVPSPLDSPLPVEIVVY